MLDVDSGLGIFGSEVAVLYKIQVDRLDRNADSLLVLEVIASTAMCCVT